MNININIKRMNRNDNPNMYFSELLTETSALIQTFNKDEMTEIFKSIKNEHFTYFKFLQLHLPKMKEAFTSKDIDMKELIDELHKQTMIFRDALQMCYDSTNVDDIGLFPDDMAKLKNQILIDLECLN